MTVFISGGCKNGKSTLALSCARALAGGGPLYYVATMIPHDQEDLARIAYHRRARAGMGFTTIERGVALPGCLTAKNIHGTFLVDSVTALLANEMFPGGVMDEDAPVRTADALAEFAGRVKNAVFVSDYLYSGDRRFDSRSEAYRRGLAHCDRTLAQVCDTVVEVCLAQYIVFKHKGNLI